MNLDKLNTECLLFICIKFNIFIKKQIMLFFREEGEDMLPKSEKITEILHLYYVFQKLQHQTLKLPIFLVFISH